MGQQRQRRHIASYVAWLPVLLSIVAVITTSIWYFYASLALLDTKAIAALISIPLPHAFTSVLPALLAASLALVILQAVLLWALCAWRTLQQYKADVKADADMSTRVLTQKKPLAICSGVLAALQYGVVMWFVFMLAISMLWYGGGMVAAKATMDGVSTMSVVDETLPRLIENAMGIDPRKQGYLVHVNGRDVNIGKSTCSLFCFTLARAMLADTIDCTCNDELAGQMMPPGNTTALIQDPFSCSASPVMCSVNEVAFTLYKKHMKPAMAAVVITVMCLLGLLSLISGTHARLVMELRTSEPISRSSSAEADLRISTSESDNNNGFKAAPDAKVAV